jgi:hypothetical protein
MLLHHGAMVRLASAHSPYPWRQPPPQQHETAARARGVDDDCSQSQHEQERASGSVPTRNQMRFCQRDDACPQGGERVSGLPDTRNFDGRRKRDIDQDVSWSLARCCVVHDLPRMCVHARAGAR